jgi:ElaB/YqjD/DUF883 family membrane-anchored ribosome-binding protein
LENTEDLLAELQQRLFRELEQGWKSTDRYVRENPWLAVAAAALVGFAAGMMASRRK